MSTFGKCCITCVHTHIDYCITFVHTRIATTALLWLVHTHMDYHTDVTHRHIDYCTTMIHTHTHTHTHIDGCITFGTHILTHTWIPTLQRLLAGDSIWWRCNRLSISRREVKMFGILVVL